MNSSPNEVKALWAIPSPPSSLALPEGFRVRLGQRVTVWADGSVLVGGAPWRISRLASPVRELVRRLAAAGEGGIALHDAKDRASARAMLDRGFLDPLPGDGESALDASIVIPALDRADNVARLLVSLAGHRVLVVDDGSNEPTALARAADQAGAELVRHEVNRGPAAARNTGIRHTAAPIIAFIDTDCVAGYGWPAGLLHHFSDPLVAAVAPRVVPSPAGGSVLERYERTRSSLDMGARPELVRPGAHLGFVPSAALLVRRTALGEGGFDEDLRLGEDVDLVWRLAEAGWLVRYDPGILVHHRTRTRPIAWLRRRYEYGTSAPDLEDRHPGRLAPARPSGWNVCALGILAAGHPVLAFAVLATASALLSRRIRALPQSPALAARTVGQGLIADAVALGHLLRREWWPIGVVALAAAPRSRTARLAAACMLAPIAWEWISQRPPLDPVRYMALRLVDDSAYGSGVLSASFANRTLRTLVPRIRIPGRADGI